MNRLLVLRWWDKATPVPRGQSPTLERPAETHDFGDGEVIEVHQDASGTYRVILVRRKGEDEEVRGLP
jgi:hypothetical protein